MSPRHEHAHTASHSLSSHAAARGKNAGSFARPAAEPFIDPVCGMTVPAGSPHWAEHAGRHVEFCSAGCRTRFLKDSTRYLAAANLAAGAIPSTGGAFTFTGSGGADVGPFTSTVTFWPDRFSQLTLVTVSNETPRLVRARSLAGWRWCPSSMGPTTGIKASRDKG